ncbi:MAG: NADH-quinone oxidoreductase subunit NuoG [Pseudomonadota bacterium]
MADDVIKLEVDGEEVTARRGQMLIEVTDAASKYVPRFCYHEKLSVAANCRMCLVEVEKAPKPLPACATPAADGMKVFTRSERAVSAQRATMEFLLINHPLDCPICDQGGECELQDLAVGYGRDVSRYTDRKRVVADKNLGPLVSTDMTRCIHCTRCVRFGQEIAGIAELGTTDRGENMRIGTFIEKSVDHELSGNIIDLCPVGALNNKPYRYSARAWEMEQRATISPHDCVGSNLYAHVLRGTVKRMVPRTNESINETWIADRDRFSYEAIYSENRLTSPRVRAADGVWRDCDWETALEAATQAMTGVDCDELGVLVSPSTTLEEQFLLRRLTEHLGCKNVDYRLGQTDFAAAAVEPAFPNFGLTIEAIEQRDAIVLIGTSLRDEAPILAHRVRKAALAGASISVIDSEDRPYQFEHTARIGELLDTLSAVGQALGIDTAALPADIAELVENASVADADHGVAAALRDAERPYLLVGIGASRHPAFAAVLTLAAALARATGGIVGQVSAGSNSAGARLLGLAVDDAETGLNAHDMFATPRQSYCLVMCDPDVDLRHPRAMDVLRDAPSVVAITSFVSDALLDAATVLLPAGTFAETSGTYINGAGTWQSFQGVATPVGEARPLWKVLRVLAEFCDVPDVGYLDSTAVLEAVRKVVSMPASLPQPRLAQSSVGVRRLNGEAAAIHVPIYEVDPVVRRAAALQLTRAGNAGQQWRGGQQET